MTERISGYLTNHSVATIAFSIYCIMWFSLFSWSPVAPVVIGEFPVAPVICFPFCFIMLLNAAFRKQHKLFYLGVAGLIFLPFFVLMLVA